MSFILNGMLDIRKKKQFSRGPGSNQAVDAHRESHWRATFMDDDGLLYGLKVIGAIIAIISGLMYIGGMLKRPVPFPPDYGSPRQEVPQTYAPSYTSPPDGQVCDTPGKVIIFQGRRKVCSY